MKSAPLDPPSDRLGALAAMIPSGSRVADIGTDHGLLPSWLLLTGRAAHCIASEPEPERLAKVHDLSLSPSIRSTLELRVGDGLRVLAPTDAIDVLVIAGLGGHAIGRILDQPGRAALGIKRYVLQPQSDPGAVRRTALRLGLQITDERLVLDRRRFYVLIAAEPGAQSLAHPALSADDLLEAGPCLIRSPDPLVRRFWEQWLERHGRILRRARPGRGHAEAVRQRDLAVRVLAALPSPAE